MPGTSPSTSRLDEREAGSSRARSSFAHGTWRAGNLTIGFDPRAAGAALALQQGFATLTERHPDWPGLRVGVNSGQVVLREIGGHGHVAYPMVGDTINTGSRLEALAPVGGVLIGAATYQRLPEDTVVEPRCSLQVKGKDEAVDAYVLRACPSCVA
jgi:class 3 adenylate cyclase